MADSTFFGDPFRRFFWSPLVWSGSPSAPAAMDWLETPSSHIFKIDVPGSGRDDVEVQLEEGNVISIRSEGSSATAAKEEQQLKEVVWHVAERGRGSFSRQIALPDNVRADQIKAHVENGVLTVVVPKEPIPPKPKPRTIAVSSKL
ncbi:16.0 kDa heat shock protein, peroxisomal-like [Musa acuminata AAA Group]|uniref:16.0 kDa heat shock protein, peroxisomal-like n=1 Tax=Musa acuminata AAA Group TaxID=214697 RepID=UPI0031D0A73C